MVRSTCLKRKVLEIYNRHRSRHDYQPVNIGTGLHWGELILGITGDPDSVHRAGASVQGWTVPEWEVPEDEWEDYIIEDQ